VKFPRATRPLLSAHNTTAPTFSLPLLDRIQDGMSVSLIWPHCDGADSSERRNWMGRRLAA